MHMNLQPTSLAALEDSLHKERQVLSVHIKLVFGKNSLAESNTLGLVLDNSIHTKEDFSCRLK